MLRILEAEKDEAIKRLHSITKDIEDVRGLQRKAGLEKDKAANEMRRKSEDPEVTSLTGNQGTRYLGLILERVNELRARHGLAPLPSITFDPEGECREYLAARLREHGSSRRS